MRRRSFFSNCLRLLFVLLVALGATYFLLHPMIGLSPYSRALLAWGAGFAWLLFILTFFGTIFGSLQSAQASLWTLVGLAAIAVGLWAHFQNVLLAAHGRQISAQVSHLVHHVTRHYVDFVVYTNTTDSYSLDYAFTVEGKSYRAHDIYVPKEVWDKAGLSSTIPVQYVDHTPEINVIDLPETRRGAGGTPIFCFICAGVCFLVAFRYWSRRPKAIVGNRGPTRAPGGQLRPGQLPRRRL